MIHRTLHHLAGHLKYQQAAYRFDAVFIQPGQSVGADALEGINSAFETEGY